MFLEVVKLYNFDFNPTNSDITPPSTDGGTSSLNLLDMSLFTVGNKGVRFWIIGNV